MKSKIDLEQTLLPALVQCFGIMFIGYILGKSKVLRHKEAKGLSLFVRYLALPSLIFVTISTVSFTDVKWEFIAAVFVAKSSLFMCVLLMTIVLTKPLDLGKSGIFAMAVTQSNDFALGYPLLVSLYSTTHPEYPSYLYIIAPIQLLILNTIGFFFMEVEKNKNDERKRSQFCYVLKSTLTNPIVLATLVGMIWNFTYGQKILPIFDITLKTFSSAFPATALVLVGYTMAEESEYSDNHISLTVTLLVITKNLICPLILQKFSAFMLEGSAVHEIESFSSFGFLYGTIPTAPSVYVFSIQYGMAVNIVTKTIIGSTIVSAPLMFASASVISLSQTGIENLCFYINQMIAYLSSITFFCSMWLLVLFMIGKKWKSIYLSPIFQLILSQFLIACGGLILFFEPAKDSTLFHIQYVLSIGAIYATRISAAFLSILLFILRWRSLCYVLRVKNKLNLASFTLCLILPFIIAGIMLRFCNITKNEPQFHLGPSQLIVTTVVTSLCLVLTVLFLILQHICFRTDKNSDSNRALYYENAVLYQNAEIDEKNNQESPENDARFFTDVEDLGKHLFEENSIEESINSVPQNSLCDSRFQCSSQQRLYCASQVSRYINNCQELEPNQYASKGIFKHTVLLIALCVIMTLNLSVCIWKLFQEKLNGIYIELEYLDIIGNYSQGIICFIIFGLDNKLIEIICSKCKKFFRSKNTLDINEATTPYICNHFATFLKRCKIDIGQTKNINNIQYKHAFSGTEFVEWLLENAVTEKIEEAEIYGSHLLKGHIIGKIDCGENLTQHPHLYQFLV